MRWQLLYYYVKPPVFASMLREGLSELKIKRPLKNLRYYEVRELSRASGI
jgi:hypothetical protein